MGLDERRVLADRCIRMGGICLGGGGDNGDLLVDGGIALCTFFRAQVCERIGPSGSAKGCRILKREFGASLIHQTIPRAGYFIPLQFPNRIQ
jgi:hypothetical protein